MPKERNAFKLGLAMIVLIALFIAVLVFLAPRGEGDMVVQVRFPYSELTTPLVPGSEVVCGGATVGRVESHGLRWMSEPDTDERQLFAVSTINLDSKVGLRQDARIIPEGTLLGGMGRLIIEDCGKGEPVKPGGMVDGTPGADFATITRTLGDQLDPQDPTSLLAMIKDALDATDANSLMGKILVALDNIGALSSSLRREFDPRERDVLLTKIHSIMDHILQITVLLRDEVDRADDVSMAAKVHRSLDALERGLGVAAEMLEDNRPGIDETLDHLRETSRILEQEIAARLAAQLDASEPASLMAKVHVSIDRLGSALADIQSITSDTRELVTLNKSQISAMIANLKQTSDHLKAASQDIRRNPWRLLYQPTTQEVADANLFDAARAFSDAATRVDDAITHLQALSESKQGGIPPEDPVLMSIMQSLQQTFEQFNQAEGALWEQLKVK
jgi:ABC-type transporter Mla subunit MlaD